MKIGSQKINEMGNLQNENFKLLTEPRVPIREL